MLLLVVFALTVLPPAEQAEARRWKYVSDFAVSTGGVCVDGVDLWAAQSSMTGGYLPWQVQLQNYGSEDLLGSGTIELKPSKEWKGFTKAGHALVSWNQQLPVGTRLWIDVRGATTTAVVMSCRLDDLLSAPPAVEIAEQEDFPGRIPPYRLAYVYAKNPLDSFLPEYQYDLEQVAIADVSSFDFSAVQAIIIAPDTGKAWQSAAPAARINTAGKPIIGVGDGGYRFFGSLGLPIGANGVPVSIDALRAPSSLPAVYTAPNKIWLDNSDTYYPYWQTNQTPLFVPAVAVPSRFLPTSSVTLLGRTAGTISTLYPFVAQDTPAGCRVLWGFERLPPSDLLHNLLRTPTCAAAPPFADRPDTFTSTLELSSSLRISDLSVGMRLAHPQASELEITLIAPTGARAVLLKPGTLQGPQVFDAGGDGCEISAINDYGPSMPLFFNSKSAFRLGQPAQRPPEGGAFAPDEPQALAAFHGLRAQGRWRLEIRDLNPLSNEGTLGCWSIEVRGLHSVHLPLLRS